ncbi:MAG: transcriptional regulator GcvA [Gammaproteobacteria bacterium]|nr:transcriptional regulator GcvA [Gammaproteobacteria bacterium]
MRKLPPLHSLRSFEAAARLGSFNGAAQEMFVTPSAVSHQIKSLEEFLGVPLFRRERRRAVLTVAGEKYLSAVEHALDEIDIATRRLQTAPNASSVNLSVVPGFLTRWLVPRIRDFQEQHPDVELRLSTSTGLIDFQHSDIDMSIYFGRGDWDQIHSEFLHNVTLVPVCSPKLLEGPHPLAKPGDLRYHTLLRVSSRQDEWKMILDTAGIARTSIDKSMTFSSTALALSAAIEGAGVALTDCILVERELKYGQLIIPLELELETSNAFFLCSPEGRKHSLGMQVFRDWIMRAIGEHIDGRAK